MDACAVYDSLMRDVPNQPKILAEVMGKRMNLLASFGLFQSRFPNVDLMEHIKDNTGGLYALRIRNKRKSTEAFFCFKNSMKGSTVSIHKELFQKAKPKNSPIIMGLESRFYLFMPADIERDCKENIRNGHVMVNFPVTSGRSLQEHEKPPEPQGDGLFESQGGKLLEKHLGPLERIG